MRRGLRGAPGRRALARGGGARDHRAGEPVPSRRPGSRRRDRRRRGDAAADTRRLPARGGRLRAAGPGPLRGGRLLPAPRGRRARADRAHPDRRGCGRGPGRPWLARRAGAPRRVWLGGSVGDAGHPPAVRGGGAGAGRGPGGVRAQAVPDPPSGGAGGGRGPVRGLDVLAHDPLQGNADGAAAGGLLPRPARRELRQSGGPRATRASPPTRSPPGRSRTRTGSAPTTARSTR